MEILVASIFYIKQRKIEFKNTFIDIINDVDFNTERTKWQLKFAFVTTSAIMIGQFYISKSNVDRNCMYVCVSS